MAEQIPDEAVIRAFLNNRAATPCPAMPAHGTGYFHATAGGRDDSTNGDFAYRPLAGSPAQRLAQAKLIVMFQDLAGRPMGEDKSTKERVRVDAHRWFFGKSDFDDWCEMAGVPPEIVRKRAGEIAERPGSWTSHRARPGEGKNAAYNKIRWAKRKHES